MFTSYEHIFIIYYCHNIIYLYKHTTHLVTMNTVSKFGIYC